jgi:hypothetical protein
LFLITFTFFQNITLVVAERESILTDERHDIFPEESFEKNPLDNGWKILNAHGLEGLRINRTLTGGPRAINLSAGPSRTACLLQQVFDVDKSGQIRRYHKIEFIINLEIAKSGSYMDVIAGLVDVESLLSFSSYGIVVGSEWPFCIVFNANASISRSLITFRNRIIKPYAGNTWYMIEVVIDQTHRTWECRITWNEDVRNANGTIEEEMPDFRSFVIGFDGASQNVLFGSVEFFYLSTPEVVAPTPLWDQVWFWSTLISGGIAISTSILLVRFKRKLKTIATQKEDFNRHIQRFLACTNPDCSFQEIPIESEYCPVCGKRLSKE